MADTPSTLAALSNELTSIAERVSRSILAVHARPRTPSSGVHWEAGVVVTADHTLKRRDEITVKLPDGRNLPAQLAGRDPTTDLAVLRVEKLDSPVADLGDAGDLRPGQLVLAVGRAADHGPGMSLGVLSFCGGPWRTWSGGQIDRFLKPDLTIFLGFSGGALADSRGRVAGINTTGLWRGAGLTVPASTVTRVARELLTKGRIARGYLGLGMQPVRLPEDLVHKLGLTNQAGMLVVTVEPGGPAASAGALIGDILLALDDNATSDIADVQAALAGRNAGTKVRASILRGGNAQELGIVLGEWTPK